MPEEGIYDNTNFTYFNNYSAEAWPAFDVPGLDCTANGAAIIKKEAEWYKDNWAFPSPFNVVADDCERDNVTGHKFLEGLGIEVNGNNFVTNAEPFSWNKTAPTCQISTQQTIEILNEQLKRYPMPANFAALFAKVYDISGEGAAGNWTNATCQPCSAAEIEAHDYAPVCGGCNVADAFTTRFMMEWGAEQEVGWGRLSTDEIPELLSIHTWYLMVALNSYEENRIKAASIAWAILDALESDSEGTTAFVGHDLQMGGLSGALGFSWDPSPWAVNTTTPGSGLRFDLDGDNLTVHYVFVNNFTTVEMKSVPVTIPGSSTPGMTTVSSLRELVSATTVEACATYRVSGSEVALSPRAPELIA